MLIFVDRTKTKTENLSVQLCILSLANLMPFLLYIKLGAWEQWSRSAVANVKWWQYCTLQN